MICQPKQTDQLNKRHGKMDVSTAEEVLHVFIYPLLESMGFDTDISNGVSQMRAATLLGEIVRLHKIT